MTLACFQSTRKILRNVYIRNMLAFQLNENKLLQFLCPLYGLYYSGDYWHAHLLRYLKNGLNMQIMACYLSLVFHQNQSTLQGMIATHVDDTLSAGSRSVEDKTQITRKLFDAKPLVYENLTFPSVTIERRSYGSRIMHQSQ